MHVRRFVVAAVVAILSGCGPSTQGSSVAGGGTASAGGTAGPEGTAGGGSSTAGGGTSTAGGGTSTAGGGSSTAGGGTSAAGGGSSTAGGGGASSSVDAGVPSTARVANPYVAAVPYVNGDWAQHVLAEANTRTGPLQAAMRTVAQQPTFIWLDRIAAVNGLRAHLDAALAQQTAQQAQRVVQIVVYDLPNRDCAALASNGELSIAAGGMARYRTEFIDPIVAMLATPKYASLRIVALIEVDSLPNLITNASVPKCAQAAGAGGYVEGITYALDRLATVPNVYAYVDLAHSGWLGWDDNRTKATDLYVRVIEGTQKKWDSVAGFATNSANYTPTEEPNLPDATMQFGGQPLRSAGFYQWNPHFDELDFATAMRAQFVARGAPQRLGMLVDTGRNGWGGSARPTTATGASVDAVVQSGRVDRRLHRGNWCNQSGAGIGERPTANPKPGVHAYVWVKPPGESDGIATPTTGPNEEGKQHDPMCAPGFTGSQSSNGGNLTGALGGAPHAGAWFPQHFELLVKNAHPPL